MSADKYLTGNVDVDVKILSELPLRDVLKLCSVNKYAKALCNKENLWKIKTRLDFPTKIENKPEEDTWKKYYIELTQAVMLRTKIFTYIRKDFDEAKFEYYRSQGHPVLRNMTNYQEFLDRQKSELNDLDHDTLRDFSVVVRLKGIGNLACTDDLGTTFPQALMILHGVILICTNF